LPQQNALVAPRAAASASAQPRVGSFGKQPAVTPSQYELVLPVPSSQQTLPAGRQPVPHGASPAAQ
jgi:hypothetical protein